MVRHDNECISLMHDSTVVIIMQFTVHNVVAIIMQFTVHNAVAIIMQWL